MSLSLIHSTNINTYVLSIIPDPKDKKMANMVPVPEVFHSVARVADQQTKAVTHITRGV